MKLSDMRYYKFFMLLFNILNIATGVIVIASCIVYMREKRSKPEQTSSISRGVVAFFVTLALFLIVTAVLACVGALKQHVRTLYVQICFYIFLITVEVIVGVGALLVNAWVGSSEDLRLSFYKNSTVADEAVRHYAWDRMQIELHCCGVDGPDDYQVIHQEIPASCCITAYPLREGGAKRQLHTSCINDRTYFMKGCDKAVKSKKSRNERLTALFVSGLVLLELSIVIMSLAMTKRIRNQRRQLQQNLQAHFES